MRGTRYATILAFAYVAAASLWIILSSELASVLAPGMAELHQLEQWKGLFFVASTGLGLFLGARALFTRIETSTEALLRHERTLLVNERRVLAGLMAASVAHDANNVLVGVLSMLDELGDPHTSPRQARESLEQLQASVERLIDLNRRLLQASRLNTNAQVVPLDLGKAVGAAVDLVRKHPALISAKVVVRCEQPVTIHAQTGLVSQFVTNLLVNAGEATEGTGRVEVRVTAGGGQARVEVHDSGPGIAQDRRATLFEALTTTKPDGNGMGLFSVRACARALGGDVEVLDSELGGACFRVTLPQGDARLRDPPDEPTRGALLAPRTPQRAR